MKKKYVITWVKTIFVILIIGALIYGTIYFLKNQYNKEEIETIKTDMLLIQGKIKIVSEKVNIKEKGASYIGTKASDMKDNELINGLIEKNLIHLESKENNYYVLDNKSLEELELKQIDLKGYYVVDYKTYEIIYADGIQDENGNILYKLSDIEEGK